MRIAPRSVQALAAILAALCVSLALAGTASAETEVQLLGRFGPEVDLTQVAAKAGPELEDVCSVASGDVCSHGNKEANGVDGRFTAPVGLGVDQSTGDVYVADAARNRVTEYDSEGHFLLAFGKEVNEAKVALRQREQGNGETVTVTRSEEDVCRAGETCLNGQPGSGAGALGGKPWGLTVEQATGDVYVVDRSNDRVVEYGPEGEFILAFGGHVDKTAVEAKAGAAAEDVCTAASEDVCQAGSEGTAHGEFAGWPGLGRESSFIAAGGPHGEEHVYVGGSERVQYFDASGAWAGEVDLKALGSGYVQGLAVDEAANVYVTYRGATGVRKYNAAGVEQAVQFDPGQPAVKAVAVTPGGDVVVVQSAESCGTGGCVLPYHGIVYDEEGNVLVPSFGEGAFLTASTGWGGGIAYLASSKVLYFVDRADAHLEGPQVLMFKGPLAFPTASEVQAEEAAGGEEAWHLTGKVFAEALDVTAMRFEYGSCGRVVSGRTQAEAEALCEESGYGHSVTAYVSGSGESIDTVEAGHTVDVEAQIEGLEAHSLYHLRLSATNANGDGRSKQPYLFETKIAPALAQTRSAEEVGTRSARLGGTVDPRNDLATYQIEYGPCPSLSPCAGVAYTAAAEVGEGGTGVRVSRPIGGLQPGTVYSFRLLTLNAAGEAGASAEATFETLPAVPPTVSLQPAGAISTHGATIAGAVDPRGTRTRYRIEVGLEEGAQTRFGTVLVGDAGAGGVATGVSAALTDLQPGTSYRYRLVALSSEGEAQAEGAFATAGLPATLTLAPAPGLLTLPVPGTGTGRSKQTHKQAKPKAKKKRHAKAKKRSNRRAKPKRKKNAHKRKRSKASRHHRRRGRAAHRRRAHKASRALSGRH